MATRKRKSVNPAKSLSSVQVDVTTELGAPRPTTTTGISTLDDLLGGGLRTGRHVLIGGEPGIGKTSLALMLAYMAARSRAAVVYASVGLDETEVVARLTSRALHREYQNVDATYGTIWSGEAMQESALRRPISSCMNTVFKKVGDLLHLHDAGTFESTATLAGLASHLWSRHERVVLVVDGIEGFSATAPSGTQAAVVNSSHETRLAQVAHDLTRLAGEGCAVLSTAQSTSLAHASAAPSFTAELRAAGVTGRRRTAQKMSLDARPVDLAVLKNRTGAIGTIPLTYFAAASVFEERAP